MRVVCVLGLGLYEWGTAVPARAETGYGLWLRYAPSQDAARRDAYRHAVTSLVAQGRTLTAAVAAADEGYVIRSARVGGRSVTVIASRGGDKILRYFQTFSQRPLPVASPASAP